MTAVTRYLQAPLRAPDRLRGLDLEGEWLPIERKRVDYFGAKLDILGTLTGNLTFRGLLARGQPDAARFLMRDIGEFRPSSARGFSFAAGSDNKRHNRRFLEVGRQSRRTGVVPADRRDREVLLSGLQINETWTH